MNMTNSGSKVHPRLMPRDLLDIIIALFIALPLQFTPVFLLLPALIWWFTGAFFWGYLTLIIIYAAWLSFTVWSLRITAKGIQFVRFFGKPKFFKWDDITDISEAPRREVVLHGWLWPMILPREMTFALSALGHFRIRWSNGYCYYPPADIEDFRRQVDEFRKMSASVSSEPSRETIKSILRD